MLSGTALRVWKDEMILEKVFCPFAGGAFNQAFPGIGDQGNE
jgi:hypothetical protein